MNLATEQFKLPFESGEPIMKKIYYFDLKDTWDKLFILSIDDYLARGEVVQVALKNQFLIKTKKSGDLAFACTTVNYTEHFSFVEKSNVLSKVPECFGTFLGKFIPVAKHISMSAPWERVSYDDLLEQSKMWEGQFYEMYCDFWCLILLNQTYPHEKAKQLGVRPAWIKLSRADMLKLWMPQYETLQTRGLGKCPAYEIAIQDILGEESHQDNSVDLEVFKDHLIKAKQIIRKSK